MTKYLITGGSGFIGSHLVRALLARGDQLVNLDVRAPFRAEHNAWWKQVDLLDKEAVDGVVDSFRPDVIVNLAAIADVLNPKAKFEVNTVGLHNLLEVTARFPVKPRIIHTSTQLVAGPGHKPSGPRDYFPYTEYGKSKADSEEVLWEWPGDIEWTIIRPTAVWGEWYPTFAASTWYYLYRRWYMVPSRGEAVRTYSYVGNLVSQIIAAAEQPSEKVNRRVFYGGDAALPSSVWLDAFSRAFTGKPAPRVPWSLLKGLALAGDLSGKIGGPSPINSGRLYRMTADFGIPLDDTLEVLGRGEFTMEEGVERTVEWLYQAFPDRYVRKR